MEPRMRDMVGIGLLVVVLLALVAGLVSAGMPG